MRTTLRSHDLIFERWGESRMGIDGQGETRLDKAIPTYIVGDTTTGTNRNVQGPAARAATISGNPVVAGLRGSTAQPAAVANGQVVDPMATAIGALVQKPFSIPELDWRASLVVAATTQTAIKAAAGAGIKNYVTALQLQNTHATVGTSVLIQDGSTTIWQGYLGPNQLAPVLIDLPTPLATTANAALNITCGAAANVLTNAQGYIAP